MFNVCAFSLVRALSFGATIQYDKHFTESQTNTLALPVLLPVLLSTMRL